MDSTKFNEKNCTYALSLVKHFLHKLVNFCLKDAWVWIDVWEHDLDKCLGEVDHSLVYRVFWSFKVGGEES